MPNNCFSFVSLIRATAPPFVLAITATTVGAMAAGTGLGLYFAGIAIAVILLPPLVARGPSTCDAFLAAGAVADGVALVWLICLFMSPVTFGQWLAAYLVLLSICATLAAMTLALRPAFGATLASAMTTIAFLAWLTWPVWLSPHLDGRAGAIAVAWLAPSHPLLALNRIFIDQGIWTQQRLMYQLTTLGQDVPYSLPSSILPCVAVHVLIALALTAPAAWSKLRPAASDPPPQATSPAP
jgi:hypothetical protein